MVYLFIGEDESAKKEKLQQIKSEFLNPASSEFNYDLLYAKETDVLSLQEILSRLPVNSPKRLVVLKEAQKSSQKIKDFLLEYVKAKHNDVILVLDIARQDARDSFLKGLSVHAKVINLGTAVYTSTFKLCDDLERKRISAALGILHQLLSEGEKPERILGGLRYCWERNYGLNPREKARRLNLLLNCDIDIKRSRLKADFSLEKLLISLCFF
ncbi:MAG: hypothetical protein PHH69_04590 [Candidatus Omnitrophica bacterium]|nr:hypothetical protein [Candidatus Omnitrophota bacterium]MDD5610800.1 hypothetical protein [Candidatus Omnitrophota bacterium]